MKRVSVIIPTYNRAHVLARAVDSVLVQTFRDFELLVVDDGSTDTTRDLMAAYGDQILYLHQEENRGVSWARNRGIQASSGEFIALLDSDDAWLPQKLARQVAALERQPDLPLCHTEEIWIRHGVRVNPKKKHHKSGGYIFSASLPLCVISPSSVLLRRWGVEAVGLFDETLPACEDYDLWLRITSRYQVVFLETPLLIKYGGHTDQLSRQHWGLDRFRIQALVKLLTTQPLNAEQHLQALDELQRKCQIMANGCRKRQKLDEWAYYTRLPSQVASSVVVTPE